MFVPQVISPQCSSNTNFIRWIGTVVFIVTHVCVWNATPYWALEHERCTSTDAGRALTSAVNYVIIQLTVNHTCTQVWCTSNMHIMVQHAYNRLDLAWTIITSLRPGATHWQFSIRCFQLKYFYITRYEVISLIMKWQDRLARVCHVSQDQYISEWILYWRHGMLDSAWHRPDMRYQSHRQYYHCQNFWQVGIHNKCYQSIWTELDIIMMDELAGV